MEIACNLENWEILCTHLSISSAEQTELKNNYQKDYKMQKIQALKLWKRKFGRKATYEFLVDVITKLVGTGFAEDIVDLALETYKGLYCILISNTHNYVYMYTYVRICSYWI